MSSLRLADIENMPGIRFRHDNHTTWLGIPSPSGYSRRREKINIVPPWQLVGWCDVSSLSDAMRRNREGQIALMYWSEDEGYVWEHYPLFDYEDRNSAVFVQATPTAKEPA